MDCKKETAVKKISRTGRIIDQTGAMTERLYQRIYAVIRQIPAGRVASYGQVARIVSDCSARQVGYALAALKPGSDVPWQRVINSQGKISLRRDGIEDNRQRTLLEAEGVRFDHKNRVDFDKFGWTGPCWENLLLPNLDKPEPERSIE